MKFGKWVATAISPASPARAVIWQSAMSPAANALNAGARSNSDGGQGISGWNCTMTDPERPMLPAELCQDNGRLGGRPPKWLPDAKASVIADFMAGMTRQAIADKRPGCTRNMICGLLHREGLSDEALGREKRRRHPMVQPAPAPKKAHKRPSKPKEPEPKPAIIHFENETRPEQAPIPNGRLSLFDLGKGQCRYPSGDGTLESPFLFCGRRQLEGGSYCKFHAGLCFGKYVQPAERVNWYRKRA